MQSQPYSLTTNSLQDIAVKCVSQYMNKMASLNEALAKEAQELELNPEQIKRTIETTNTLAYLRMLKEASDRTFEFPVADYNGVLSAMVMPEKQASQYADSEAGDTASNSISEENEHVTKKYNLDPQEKRAMLAKETMRCREVLTKMAEEKTSVFIELVDQANLVGKDPLALEKLAEVFGEDSFYQARSLCGIEKTASIGKEVFFTEELSGVEKLKGLYKKAHDLVKEEAELSAFVKRAEAVLFTKEAFLGKVVGGALSRLGSGVGRVLGAGVGKIGQTAKKIVYPGTSSGFADMSRRRGYASTKEGVGAFDKLKSTSHPHSGEVEKRFGNTKPSRLVHRIGIVGGAGEALNASMGFSMDHKNKIWEEL